MAHKECFRFRPMSAQVWPAFSGVDSGRFRGNPAIRISPKSGRFDKISSLVEIAPKSVEMDPALADAWQTSAVFARVHMWQESDQTRLALTLERSAPGTNMGEVRVSCIVMATTRVFGSPRMPCGCLRGSNVFNGTVNTRFVKRLSWTN